MEGTAADGKEEAGLRDENDLRVVGYAGLVVGVLLEEGD